MSSRTGQMSHAGRSMGVPPMIGDTGGTPVLREQRGTIFNPRTDLADPRCRVNVPATPVFRKLICIGHRGAAGYEPENTLRSIRRALDFGAHGVEIDVQLVDGELVVFHDSTVDRTTNGIGSLSRHTFEQLRRLDAGHGERIPTLREVCELVRGRAFLNIELKGKGTAAPVSALLARLVEEGGWSYDSFLVSSFSVRELKTLRQEGAPEIPVGLLLGRRTHFWRRIARLLKASTVNPSVRFASERMTHQAHEEGWKVFPFTVNEPLQIERMREIGVDGVFTDFPDRVLGMGH